MKKTTYAFELSVLLIFFVFPPIFSAFSSNFSFAPFDLKYFLSETIRFFIAIFLLYSLNFFRKKDLNQTPALLKLTLNSSHVLITAGFLFLFSAIIQFTAERISFFKPPQTKALFSINIPLFLFFVSVALASFYEESVYRVFIPEVLLIFSSNRFALFFEAICVLLFSLAHLYQGIAGFINAFLSGIVLRLCCKKTRNVFCPFAAHCAYNFFAYFVIFVLQK